LTVNKKSISVLPEKLASSLYNFQKEGIEAGIRMFGRILIGDEMGVGKTIQAIGIAYIYKNDWPLLIITPASLKYTWRDEIRKWLPSVAIN
jgi:SNF2 family DNA or RNA helicase